MAQGAQQAGATSEQVLSASFRIAGAEVPPAGRPALADSSLTREIIHLRQRKVVGRKRKLTIGCLTNVGSYGWAHRRGRRQAPFQFTRSICASCRAVLLFDCLVILGYSFGLTMLHRVFYWFVLGYLDIIWNLPYILSLKCNFKLDQSHRCQFILVLAR
jgi:hypothetical protein